jgi:DNA (cytosine-5)-methyltransferase 1
MLKFIDLFCGIGGFHQAMNKLAIPTECVFACDIDKECRKIYQQNYGLLPAEDITKVDEKMLPDFDVICAGFPCQSFSQAGKKLSLEDKRGLLFEHILRIAKEKKPRFMFLENVKHIKKIDDGKVFEYILKRIKETGYNVQVEELSPHQLGIPQHRERVIFICIAIPLAVGAISLGAVGLVDNEIPDKIPFILPTINETTDEQIQKILLPWTEEREKYLIPKELVSVLEAWNEMIQVFEVGENMSPTILCNEFLTDPTNSIGLVAWKKEYITKNKRIYQKYEPLWQEWLEKHQQLLNKKEIYAKLEWQAGKKRENDSIWDHFIQLRQSGIRIKKGDFFPALVAIVQVPIYAKEKRYICPRECARLQSFPDTFIMHEKDKIAYKQFGNAVNVDVLHFFIKGTLDSFSL